MAFTADIFPPCGSWIIRAAIKGRGRDERKLCAGTSLIRQRGGYVKENYIRKIEIGKWKIENEIRNTKHEIREERCGVNDAL
jgi:hypothetical protein